MGRSSKTDKNKKALLDAFGENYTTYEYNGGYLLYDKKMESQKSNNMYVGRFYLTTDGDAYVFQDTRYKTADELIGAMWAYNKTLPFNHENYNPVYKKNYMVESCLHDYLKSLGFKMDCFGRGDDDTYILSDAFGQHICVIVIKVEEDTTKGKLTRYIATHNDKQDKWVEAPFTDLESAVGACNSLLISYCAVVQGQLMNIFKAMSNARSTILLDKTFDWSNLNTYVDDATKSTIELLEKELNQLKTK